MVNEVNFDKLVKHVSELDMPLEDWAWDKCFCGMIRRIMPSDGHYSNRPPSPQMVMDYLGIGYGAAYELTYMSQITINEWRVMTLDNQKKTMLYALQTAREGKAVDWRPR